ncbi:BNIP3 protein, partial [Acromyrmex heyeri]
KHSAENNNFFSNCAESWVELVPDPPLAARTTPTPFSITGEREYLRLLREAQRDSTHSSAKHSLASSRRDTPRDSPKSPPNSPNTELSTEDELKGVYINYGCNKGRLIYGTVNKASRRRLVALSFKSVRFAATAFPTSWIPTRRRRWREEKRGRDSTRGGEGELLEKNTDWIYEWSSRPDQAPPKDWKFKHPLGSKRKTYSIRTAKVGKNGLFSKEVIYTLFFTNLLSLLIGTGLGVLLTRRGLMMSRVAIE